MAVASTRHRQLYHVLAYIECLDEVCGDYPYPMAGGMDGWMLTTGHCRLLFLRTTRGKGRRQIQD
jgi:hypothetical protein